MEPLTFPFILLFDLLFDKNSSSQGTGEAIGSGVLSVIVRTSCIRTWSRHFSRTRAASVSQPYKTFMRPKWRCKLGIPMLMAEDGPRRR
jgi:hypothetical protein